MCHLVSRRPQQTELVFGVYCRCRCISVSEPCWLVVQINLIDGNLNECGHVYRAIEIDLFFNGTFAVRMQLRLKEKQSHWNTTQSPHCYCSFAVWIQSHANAWQLQQQKKYPHICYEHNAENKTRPQSSSHLMNISENQQSTNESIFIFKPRKKTDTQSQCWIDCLMPMRMPVVNCDDMLSRCACVFTFSHILALLLLSD